MHRKKPKHPAPLEDDIEVMSTQSEDPTTSTTVLLDSPSLGPSSATVVTGTPFLVGGKEESPLCLPSPHRADEDTNVNQYTYRLQQNDHDVQRHEEEDDMYDDDDDQDRVHDEEEDDCLEFTEEEPDQQDEEDEGVIPDDIPNKHSIQQQQSQHNHSDRTGRVRRGTTGRRGLMPRRRTRCQERRPKRSSRLSGKSANPIEVEGEQGEQYREEEGQQYREEGQQYREDEQCHQRHQDDENGNQRRSTRNNRRDRRRPVKQDPIQRDDTTDQQQKPDDRLPCHRCPQQEEQHQPSTPQVGTHQSTTGTVSNRPIPHRHIDRYDGQTIWINGRPTYEIGAYLGGGTAGVVYSATDIRTGKLFALKCLNPIGYRLLPGQGSRRGRHHHHHQHHHTGHHHHHTGQLIHQGSHNHHHNRRVGSGGRGGAVGGGQLERYHVLHRGKPYTIINSSSKHSVTSNNHSVTFNNTHSVTFNNNRSVTSNNKLRPENVWWLAHPTSSQIVAAYQDNIVVSNSNPMGAAAAGNMMADTKATSSFLMNNHYHHSNKMNHHHRPHLRELTLSQCVEIWGYPENFDSNAFSWNHNSREKEKRNHNNRSPWHRRNKPTRGGTDGHNEGPHNTSHNELRSQNETPHNSSIHNNNKTPLPPKYIDFLRERSGIYREINNQGICGNHPNVLGLFEVLELVQDSKATVFLVLEIANGGELFDRIPLHVGLGGGDESLAKYYMQQLLNGIQHCHAQGVCHRDIKPENLLINDHYKGHEEEQEERSEFFSTERDSNQISSLTLPELLYNQDIVASILKICDFGLSSGPGKGAAKSALEWAQYRKEHRHNDNKAEYRHNDVSRKKRYTATHHKSSPTSSPVATTDDNNTSHDQGNGNDFVIGSSEKLKMFSLEQIQKAEEQGGDDTRDGVTDSSEIGEMDIVETSDVGIDIIGCHHRRRGMNYDDDPTVVQPSLERLRSIVGSPHYVAPEIRGTRQGPLLFTYFREHEQRRRSRAGEHEQRNNTRRVQTKEELEEEEGCIGRYQQQGTKNLLDHSTNLDTPPSTSHRTQEEEEESQNEETTPMASYRPSRKSSLDLESSGLSDDEDDETVQNDDERGIMCRSPHDEHQDDNECLETSNQHQSTNDNNNSFSSYDGRLADVWSCGVVLYAMLTGSLPFGDDIMVCPRFEKFHEFQCIRWQCKTKNRLFERRKKQSSHNKYQMSRNNNRQMSRSNKYQMSHNTIVNNTTTVKNTSPDSIPALNSKVSSDNNKTNGNLTTEVNTNTMWEYPDWFFPGGLSDEAKDLLCCMLEPHPDRRITVSQALEHGWFGLTDGEVESDSFGSILNPYQEQEQEQRGQDNDDAKGEFDRHGLDKEQVRRGISNSAVGLAECKNTSFHS